VVRPSRVGVHIETLHELPCREILLDEAPEEKSDAMALPRGAAQRVRIVEVHPDSVTVDGNHPLAGKIIELEVNLISLDSSASANKQNPQFDLGGQG